MDSMDINACLKNYIGSFRIRELHDCLARLDLRPTGSKAEKVTRLKEHLEAERTAGRLDVNSRPFLVVLDVYREMRGLQTGEVMCRQSGAISSVKCICQVAMPDSSLQRTVSCVTPGCGRQEHLHCLFHSNMIPDWSRDGHRCIQCRYYFADPFWMNCRLRDIIPPTLIREMQSRGSYCQNGAPTGYKLTIDGFNLHHADLMQIRSSAAKIQIACLRLDDPVQFRFHWPVNCKLAVNSKNLRVYPRHGDYKITMGQRDEPTDISKLVVAGKNSIEVSCQDENQYAFCIQMVTPVKKEMVMRQMHPPEIIDAAIMRMRRIVRSLSRLVLHEMRVVVVLIGQISNDADDEVQTMTSMMSLKCPFSSKRIQTPARLLNIDSLECVFDLDAFISIVQKTRKWACPHSLRQSSVHHLAKDVWLEAVLTCLQNLPDVHEIEVSKEGTWRLRGESKWRSVYNTFKIDALPDSLMFVNGAAEMDDESEDELEEMRQAALAAKEAVKQHYQENNKCSKNLEVVDLISSEEETETQIQQSPPPTILSGTGSAGLGEEREFVGLVEAMHGISRLNPVGHSGPQRHTDFQQAMRASSMAKVVAENYAFGQSDEMRGFHPVLTTVHPPPVTSGHGLHPVQTSNYPNSRFFQQSNFTVAPVQLHPQDGTIFVKQSSISIPSSGCPKPNKRPGELLEIDSSRRIERLNHRRRQTVVHDWPVPQMECIEIDMDDSDKE